MSAPPDVAHVMSHLAELRREDGKTQEAIAREIEVSVWTVGRWERGTEAPTLAHAMAYMRALGLRLSYVEEVPRG